MKTTLQGNWKQKIFHTIVYTKSLFASDQVSKDTQLYAPAVGRQHYWLSYIGTNNIESKESVKKRKRKMTKNALSLKTVDFNRVTTTLDP